MSNPTFWIVIGLAIVAVGVNVFSSALLKASEEDKLKRQQARKQAHDHQQIA